jgi:hypothetical protein
MNTSVELGQPGLVPGNLFSVDAEWAGTVERVIADGVYEVAWAPRLHHSKYAKSWRRQPRRSGRRGRYSPSAGSGVDSIVAQDTMDAVNAAWDRMKKE